MRIRGDNFFEVYNGHPSVHNSGDRFHASTERIWDIMLAHRFADLNLPILYGLATDDGHRYHHIPSRGSEPGRGWIMVLSPEFTPGRCSSASSGPVLRHLRRAAAAGTRAGGLDMAVDAEPGCQLHDRLHRHPCRLQPSKRADPGCIRQRDPRDAALQRRNRQTSSRPFTATGQLSVRTARTSTSGPRHLDQATSESLGARRFRAGLGAARPRAGGPEAMTDWEFWIDVGGTFTDCLASLARRDRPGGSSLARFSVRASPRGSSEVDGVDLAFLDDASRRPCRFLARLRDPFADAVGQVVHRGSRTSFDRRRCTLTLAIRCPRRSKRGPVMRLVSDEDAPLLAIRLILGLPRGEPIPPVFVKLGTTRGTNACLTRTGARTAFVTTRGFGDVLLIGNQDRPRLFDLAIRKPEPLFERVVEIDERIDAAGSVLRAPKPRLDP